MATVPDGQPFTAGTGPVGSADSAGFRLGTRIAEAGPVGLAFPRVRGPGTGVGAVAPGGDAPEATEAQDTTTGSSRQAAASRAPAPLRSRGTGDHSSPLGGVRMLMPLL